MCGQYELDSEEEAPEMRLLMDALRRRVGETPAFAAMARGRVRPTDIAPAWTAGGAVLMRWGFHGPERRPVINARAETVAEKPLFAGPLKTGRCLIPAARFLEWGRMGHACRVPGVSPLYMAGLYRFEPQLALPVFVILTRPSEGGISDVHPRMPVLIPRPALRAWLEQDAAAEALLRADPPALRLWAV
jgi:putative SOS response-associated peptidase YedK